MTLRLLRYALFGVFVAVGLSVLGLVAYSYFFLNEEAPVRVRGETAVNTNQLILTTSQGRFLDKSQPLDPTLPPAPVLGGRAPDFELKDPNGNAMSLSQFRGTPVLLNFWATWCPPCRKEMPDLQAFFSNYGDKIQMLGVNLDYAAQVDITSQQVLKFLDEYDISYPNLMDPEGTSIVSYRLTGFPVTFWIDEEGFIRGVWLGAMKEDDILTGFQKITDVLDEHPS